ncbi:hypothetical protein MKW92_042752, partial [Papaver armeniacum]
QRKNIIRRIFIVIHVKEGFKTLKYILRAFMLRQTKAMLVECGTLVLPRLTEMTVSLFAFSSGASSLPLQNIVIQLREACSHPCHLFPGIEPEPYEVGEHLVQASGKLLILDHLLQKLHNAGHRVLLFSQMTHTLDILQDYLELRKYTYARLEGSVRAEERFGAVRRFSERPVKGTSNSQNDHNGAFVFLISTRADGVDLNLVGADTVVFYEQDWNPQVDKQALQRVHRIGQINPVLCEDDISYDQDEMGADVGDLRSIIFGLHMFDPTNTDNENPNEKVTKCHESSYRRDRKFELNSMDVLGGDDFPMKTTPAYSFDEASYLSWVEKNLPDERIEKLEAVKRKAEEKKLLNYVPVCNVDGDMVLIGSGSVQFVYGDCTVPSKVCPSEPAIIFSGNGRSEWYTMERLLQKYGFIYSIRSFVYYFLR